MNGVLGSSKKQYPFQVTHDIVAVSLVELALPEIYTIQMMSRMFFLRKDFGDFGIFFDGENFRRTKNIFSTKKIPTGGMFWNHVQCGQAGLVGLS